MKPNIVRAFHVMTKPIGPVCNLDCQYCFYTEKTKFYPQTQDFKMSDKVLENYIRQYIEAQDVPEISFAWQGGEPTLLGIEFFQHAVDLQKKYLPMGKRVFNAIQTNGTLLDDAWCKFLRDNKFLVGLSLDGPEPLHDRYRRDKAGQPTFEMVMEGLELLKEHQVDFNILTVVNRANSQKPLEVYRFLKQSGATFLQFIPLVERVISGGTLAGPPSQIDSGEAPRLSEASPLLSEASVEPLAFGKFLNEIFQEWVHHDVGKVFVQLFDVQLGIQMGRSSTLCYFSKTCGQALALEHNGDLFPCDHYVYPELKLGNMMEAPLAEMAHSEKQVKFGQDKSAGLPGYCRKCQFLYACNGECPKHRFRKTADGEFGLNYLCEGYKAFFGFAGPYLGRLADMLRVGRPASDIMTLLAGKDYLSQPKSVGRNDPCPCGSRIKYKKCHGAAT